MVDPELMKAADQEFDQWLANYIDEWSKEAKAAFVRKEAGNVRAAAEPVPGASVEIDPDGTLPAPGAK
jgi:hypothetical protein